MNKKYMVIAATYLLFVLTPVFSQIIKVKPEKVMDFILDGPAGFEYRETGNKDEFTYPVAAQWMDETTLRIYDPASGMYKYFKNFIFSHAELICSDELLDDPYIRYIPEYIKETPTAFCFLNFTWGSARIINKNTRKMTYVWFAKDIEYVEVIGSFCFGWNKSNELFLRVFNEAGAEPGPIMDMNIARDYLVGIGGGKEKLSIDNYGVLYINDIPYLDSARNLIKYYSSYDTEWMNSPLHVRRMGDFFFIRRFEDGTSYWAGGDGSVTVVNKDGNIIAYITPEYRNDISYGTSFALHPSGDIYWIGHQWVGDKAALYRQKKIW